MIHNHTIVTGHISYWYCNISGYTIGKYRGQKISFDPCFLSEYIYVSACNAGINPHNMTQSDVQYFMKKVIIKKYVRMIDYID